MQAYGSEFGGFGSRFRELRFRTSGLGCTVQDESLVLTVEALGLQVELRESSE